MHGFIVVVALAASHQSVAAQKREATPTETLVGRVRLVGSSPGTRVTLLVDREASESKAVADKELIDLAGPLVDELRRLQAAIVEVAGERDEKRFVVRYYYILNVGNGIEPAVGTVVALADGMLGLSDGVGKPIPLSIRPAAKPRLSKYVGGKLWIHGKQLVSGQLKVLRYGLIKPPPSALAESEAKAKAKEAAPAEGAPASEDAKAGTQQPPPAATARSKP